MSIKPVSTQCECQNRISNVRIDFFDSVRMAMQDFECQNSLFRLCANVRVRFRISKLHISTQCECQNRISNAKLH